MKILCCTIYLLSIYVSQSKWFEFILDTSRETEWFTLIQSEERINFYFFVVQTKALDEKQVMILKYATDVYAKDIARENLEIDWANKLLSVVSKTSIFKEYIAVGYEDDEGDTDDEDDEDGNSLGGFEVVIVDYETLVLRCQKQNEMEILKIELPYILNTSEHWKIMNNIPGLEEHVFSKFKTLLVPSNKKGKLSLNLLNEENIFVHLHCQFEVFPNAATNKVRIVRRDFQVLKQTESEKGIFLESLQKDCHIREDIQILERKVIFEFRKGEFVLKAEIEVGDPELLFDFSDIVGITTYYLNGTKLEQEHSCPWKFSQTVKNPNVHLDKVLWFKAVFFLKSKNRHRLFVEFFVPTYSFATREEVEYEYHLRFPFLVEWRESDQTAFTNSLYFADFVLPTNAIDETEHELDLELDIYNMRVKIPWIVKRKDNCIKTYFFPDGINNEPIENPNEVSVIGSVSDGIVEKSCFQKFFKFKFAPDEKGLNLNKYRELRAFAGMNYETILFETPSVETVPLPSVRYNELIANAHNIQEPTESAVDNVTLSQ